MCHTYSRSYIRKLQTTVESGLGTLMLLDAYVTQDLFPRIVFACHMDIFLEWVQVFFVFFSVCVDKWNYYVIFCWRCRPLLRSTGSYILCVIGNLKDPVVVWSSANSEYISGLSWNTLLRMEVCFYYLMTAL